jgi:hypothetical protein
MAAPKKDYWEQIFAVKNFDLSKDHHVISASEIKQITKGGEPRLIARMDRSSHVPAFLKKTGYFPLPDKHGNYVLIKGNGFHTLEPNEEVEEFVSEALYDSISYNKSQSENKFIQYADDAKAIEKIIGRGPLSLFDTSKQRSNEFSFRVGKVKMDVKAVQFETDRGLQGHDCIVLLEGKSENVSDFIVRQLFYPYQHFRTAVPNKEIIPVFFIHDPKNEIYKFWVYEFKNPNNYNSIKLKSTHSLKILHRELIPQANDLTKVINVAQSFAKGSTTTVEVAQNLRMATRQGQYYCEAAHALKLLEIKDGSYALTPKGQQLAKLSREKQQSYLCTLVSEHKMVQRAMDVLAAKKEITKKDLEKLIAEVSARNEINLNEDTISRRASSLRSWLSWFGEKNGKFIETSEGFETIEHNFEKTRLAKQKDALSV